MLFIYNNSVGYCGEYWEALIMGRHDGENARAPHAVLPGK